MNPKELPEREHPRSVVDLAEHRYRRRLKETLGINPAGIEVILRLRRQVVELQARTHQLEAELSTRRAGQDIHLGRVCKVVLTRLSERAGSRSGAGPW
jgi:hypothetical protein